MKQEAKGDQVLQDIWRIKDTLSAAYDHDVDRLAADAQKRQKLSGHPGVDLQIKLQPADQSRSNTP